MLLQINFVAVLLHAVPLKGRYAFILIAIFTTWPPSATSLNST
jgi:hypothetical protein